MNLIKPTVVALALLFSNTGLAQTVPSGKNDLQMRQKSYEKAFNIVDILGGELILQKGNPNAALGGYLLVLERSNDTAVASRAFDLALMLDKQDVAMIILKKWRTIEPVPSAPQQQAIWKLNLMQNKPEAWKNLPEIFKSLSEEEAAKAFYVLTSYADTRGNQINNDYKVLTQVAAKYPELPEAALCLSAYAVFAQDKNGAVKYLQQLARLAPQPTMEAQFLLGIILKVKPDYLVAFFEKTPDKALGFDWRQYKVDALMAQDRNEEALNTIKSLLTETEISSALYLQAGYLSQQLDKPLAETTAYYEKAYQLGGEASDKAALLVGALAYDNKDYDNAKKWFTKIKDARLLFDKNIFLAWLSLEENKVNDAQRYVDLITQEKNSGNFFDRSDLDAVQLAIWRQQNNHKKYLGLIERMIKESKDETKQNLLIQDQAFYLSDVMGQPEKAIPILRSLLAKDKENADYLNSLGYSLLSISDHEQEAYELIKKAYDKDTDSAAINDSLGWVLFKLNQPEKSLPYLQFAFDNLPNAEVAAHLGEVLWHLGRKDEARAIWEKGMKEDAKDRVLLETRKRFGIK